MRSLVWLRSDLRVEDNSALSGADRAATDGVACAFVISPDEWRVHDWAPVKVGFLLRSLRDVSARLAALNIPLVVLLAERGAEVPGLIAGLAERLNVGEVRWNVEYEVDETARDAATRALLERRGVRVYEHHDQTVVPPHEVRTGSGGFYTVFTPFKRAWMERVREMGGPPEPLPAARKQRAMIAEAAAQAGAAAPFRDVPARVEGFSSGVDPKLWPGGERDAKRALERFIEARAREYAAARDIPAIEGTSGLSHHLALGTISARACLRAAWEANHRRLDSGSKGLSTWMSELVWREFFRHVLVGFPRVCMHRPLKPGAAGVRWREDDAAYDAWREGRTGYPIVDGAMRQLATTGWMHNRLRMISAMFLSKHLLLDWRLGERHFMRSLVDGDLANNNGGWQWSAGTGADAAPYFRIFNPTTQSERFDPRGEFVRRFVPELSGVDDQSIHEPPALVRARTGYPMPIVEHVFARARALDAFKVGARA